MEDSVGLGAVAVMVLEVKAVVVMVLEVLVVVGKDLGMVALAEAVMALESQVEGEKVTAELGTVMVVVVVGQVV